MCPISFNCWLLFSQQINYKKLCNLQSLYHSTITLYLFTLVWNVFSSLEWSSMILISLGIMYSKTELLKYCGSINLWRSCYRQLLQLYKFQLLYSYLSDCMVSFSAKTSFPVFLCFVSCCAYLGSTHDAENKSLELKEIVHSGKDDLSTSLLFRLVFIINIKGHAKFNARKNVKLVNLCTHFISCMLNTKALFLKGIQTFILDIPRLIKYYISLLIYHYKACECSLIHIICTWCCIHYVAKN